MTHTLGGAELVHRKPARRTQFVPKELQAISELSTPKSTHIALEHLKALAGHLILRFSLRKGIVPTCQPALYLPRISSSPQGIPLQAYPEYWYRQ